MSQVLHDKGLNPDKLTALALDGHTTPGAAGSYSSAAVAGIPPAVFVGEKWTGSRVETPQYMSVKDALGLSQEQLADVVRTVAEASHDHPVPPSVQHLHSRLISLTRETRAASAKTVRAASADTRQLLVNYPNGILGIVGLDHLVQQQLGEEGQQKLSAVAQHAGIISATSAVAAQREAERVARLTGQSKQTLREYKAAVAAQEQASLLKSRGVRTATSAAVSGLATAAAAAAAAAGGSSVPTEMQSSELYSEPAARRHEMLLRMQAEHEARQRKLALHSDSRARHGFDILVNETRPAEEVPSGPAAVEGGYRAATAGALGGGRRSSSGVRGATAGEARAGTAAGGEGGAAAPGSNSWWHNRSLNGYTSTGSDAPVTRPDGSRNKEGTLQVAGLQGKHRENYPSLLVQTKRTLYPDEDLGPTQAEVRKTQHAKVLREMEEAMEKQRAEALRASQWSKPEVSVATTARTVRTAGGSVVEARSTTVGGPAVSSGTYGTGAGLEGEGTWRPDRRGPGLAETRPYTAAAVMRQDFFIDNDHKAPTAVLQRTNVLLGRSQTASAAGGAGSPRKGSSGAAGGGGGGGGGGSPSRHRADMSLGFAFAPGAAVSQLNTGATMGAGGGGRGGGGAQEGSNKGPSSSSSSSFPPAPSSNLSSTGLGSTGRPLSRLYSTRPYDIITGRRADPLLLRHPTEAERVRDNPELPPGVLPPKPHPNSFITSPFTPR